MPGYEIPLFDLNFSEAEEQAVANTISSGWISMGAQTAELEERFAEYLGSRHAVALSSCTAALHIAMAMLVEPGDEVIVPSLTFVATANAVCYAGAKPVFADVVGPEDLTLDPDDVRRRIGPRTRAIIPMHYSGFPCDMEALMGLAEEHGLEVVEDAAHAPDAEYRGKRLGTIGRIGCFSFYSNKNMTCAEGGMLVTDDDELARRARLLRSHGMTTLSWDRARGHATSYDVVELGYNFRLDDIRASLALVQLSRLPTDTERRRLLRSRYEANLADLPGVIVPFQGCLHSSSEHIMPVVLRDANAQVREAVRAELARNGIQTTVHYPAVHRFAIYSDVDVTLPKTEYVADCEITLPLFGNMTFENVDRVCETLASSSELLSCGIGASHGHHNNH